MKEIVKERIRNDKTGMITVYKEFKEEITKHEQRNRAVDAMLGPGAAATPPPAHTPPPAGAGSWAQVGVWGELGEGEVEGESTQFANS